MFGRSHLEESKEKMRQAALGKRASEETKKKMSEMRKGKPGYWKGKSKLKGEKCFNWKGGTYSYWHRIAWKLFGKTYCEKCNKDIIDYIKESGQRFDIHNTLNPKDYKVMESEAWQTLCHSCHMEIENGKY